MDFRIFFSTYLLYGKDVWILPKCRLVILTILEDATVGILVAVEGVPIPVGQLYVQHLCQPVKGTSENHIYALSDFISLTHFGLLGRQDDEE